ncbi:MAG: prepilin-type N-terminal cleavage/methylation domain-containing protein [PVC group bacterium]|nr:prepilin-type N-terminal cleavage/methylation domain-containing protein [PVC group bacterium]
MKKYLGFTLVELLLSVVIMSVVFLTVYSTFSLGVEAWKKSGSRNVYEARTILSQISEDLRSACIPVSKEQRFSFNGNAASLSFVTAASSHTGMNKVRYYVTPGKFNDTRSLVYRVDDILNTDINALGKVQELTGTLNVLSFSYYDGEQWLRAWNSAETMPQAVQISLALQDDSGREEFSAVVEVSCN